MNIRIFFIIIFLVSACTLSTQQEIQLQQDIYNYIEIRNENDALSYMNYTHPLVVRHYKDLGDSAFQKKFLIENKNNENQIGSEIRWKNGIIKQSKKKDTTYQAKIIISTSVSQELNDEKEIIVFAYSTKSSNKWLFIEEQDYFEILPKNLQFFQSEN